MIDFLVGVIEKYEISHMYSNEISYAIISFVAIVLALLSNIIAKKVILTAIHQYIKKTKSKWDDILFERNVFKRLAHLAPAIIIFLFASIYTPEVQDWIQRLALSYMGLVGVYTIHSLLDAVNDIYNTFEISKERPIKGYIQVVKIFVYIMGGILIISVIIDKSPWILVSGIGAMTAVILLVFRDSLLGLVAGIQLAANDMVHIGDWIEMPKYGADGDVIEITLNTVKVRNFDKTIVTIPSYSLISDSFKNWRGMNESGGRRIKRAIYIDITSIKFCNEHMLNKFKSFRLLKDYFNKKLVEIETYNKEIGAEPTELINGRRLTNVGTFRVYVHEYLKNHPRVHKDMTLMVRQLPPTEYGLPIEIYAFVDDTVWANYEAIQSDVFDHLLAVVPQFELRVFQNSTGYDFNLIKSGVDSTNK